MIDLSITFQQFYQDVGSNMKEAMPASLDKAYSTQ